MRGAMNVGNRILFPRDWQPVNTTLNSSLYFGLREETNWPNEYEAATAKIEAGIANF